MLDGTHQDPRQELISRAHITFNNTGTFPMLHCAALGRSFIITCEARQVSYALHVALLKL